MIQQFYFWVYTPKDLKPVFQKEICTFVFLAALFTVAQEVRVAQGIHWLMSEKAKWSIHTIGYHSALKSKPILIHMWMNLEDVTWSDINRHKRIDPVWSASVARFIKIEPRWWLRGGGREGLGRQCLTGSLSSAGWRGIWRGQSGLENMWIVFRSTALHV